MIQERFIYISNIPRNYHACHLRNFYSHYVESSAFLCFHFRHRPQANLSDLGSSIASSTLLSSIKFKCHRDKSRLCSILSITSDQHDRFCKEYDRTHWLSPDDELPLRDECIITPIFIDREGDRDALLKLIEFKPPTEMPRGNVGTPTRFFLTQIQACRLDRNIIKKLQLDFSHLRRQRKYGAVPYSYDSPVVEEALTFPGELRSRSGVPILDAAGYADYTDLKIDSIDTSPIQQTKSVEEDDPQDDLPETLEDKACEEWERFEALHDDPYKVTRYDKANLKYEDKVELVWEKGGSGLVFHTDERTWRKLDPLRKEEPFDEPASLDWDIDMEPYEQTSDLPTGPTPTGNWGSARDTCDLIDIQRAREEINISKTGNDTERAFHSQTGFQGFGRCLLQRMGWKPGNHLGPVHHTEGTRRRGLLYPLESDEHTRSPGMRAGIGYYGSRLDCSLRPTSEHQKVNTVYIRTIFDSAETVSQRDGSSFCKSLIRRDDPQFVLKYRYPLKANEESVSPPIRTSQFVPHSRTVILTPHQNLSKEGITFVPGGLLFPTLNVSDKN